MVDSSSHGHKGSKKEEDGNLHGDGDDDCKRMLDQLMLGDSGNYLYILDVLVIAQCTFYGTRSFEFHSSGIKMHCMVKQ